MFEDICSWLSWRESAVRTSHKNEFCWDLHLLNRVQVVKSEHEFICTNKIVKLESRTTQTIQYN